MKTAPIVLMEDNLSKAKRALMSPKQLCPSGLNIQAIESKNHIGEKDKSILLKLRETMIRKNREYRTLFPKYSRDAKKDHCSRRREICNLRINKDLPEN